MARASNLMIGTLTLALIAGSLGGWLGYRKYTGIRGETPFRVIFEGSASGVRKGSGVNFAGVRVGEVVSLKLDHHRVIAMTRIDNNTPIRKDTQVGLEFRADRHRRDFLHRRLRRSTARHRQDGRHSGIDRRSEGTMGVGKTPRRAAQHRQGDRRQ